MPVCHRHPASTRLRAVLSAVLVAGWTAACAPDFAPLAGDVPDLPEHYAATRTGETSNIAQWPDLFSSAELSSLARATAKGNLDIAAAAARIKQAEGAAQIAGANLWPDISGGQNASRNISPGTLKANTPPFTRTATNAFSLGLSASYIVDLFGRERLLSETARADAIAVFYDRETVALASTASLTNLYFQLLAAQDRRRFALENTRTAEQVLEAIRARADVGTATALDVAQQEGMVASQRASVPALDQTIAQSRNLIAVLTGRTPESLTLAGGSLRALRSPAVQAGLPADLLVRRPDIAAAELRLAAERANVEAARRAFLPTITLTASASHQSGALKNLLRPDALASSLAQGLTQPIFDGGALSGRLRQAEGRESEMLQTYRKAILTGLSDVENALVAIEQTTRHERLQGRVVATAQRAQSITAERLREGTIDVVTLLNTQLTLFQAQDQLTQVRLQKYQAYVSLFQALGGGWSRAPNVRAEATP
jgi:NodT family efflux transporter outer membrane factor (OMF) lipoprotein